MLHKNTLKHLEMFGLEFEYGEAPEDIDKNRYYKEVREHGTYYYGDFKMNQFGSEKKEG